MKLFSSFYLLIALGLFGCGSHISPALPTSTVESDKNILSQIEQPKENMPIPSQEEPKNFVVEHGNMKFSAAINSLGTVTILDYPHELRGKIKIVKFDEKVNDYNFSPQECNKIRRDVQGLGLGVRNSYYAKLVFEIPPFLAYNFIIVLRKSAIDAGIKLDSLEIENTVDTIKSTVDVVLSDDAMSHFIGNVGFLADQVHLGQKGYDQSPFERLVIVSSGDFLCDLVAGKAHVIMNYPITNEDKKIKIIYDYIETALK